MTSKKENETVKKWGMTPHSSFVPSITTSFIIIVYPILHSKLSVYLSTDIPRSVIHIIFHFQLPSHLDILRFL